jgi:hypothetical protein
MQKTPIAMKKIINTNNLFIMRISTKCLTLGLLMAAAGAPALHAEAPEAIPLTGFMAVSDAWNDDADLVAYYGFYRFNSDGSGGGIQSVSPTVVPSIQRANTIATMSMDHG